MRNSHPCLSCLLVTLAVLFSILGQAQKDKGYRDLATPQTLSNKLAPPDDLRNYIVDGKLRLSLREAVVLTLENNSLVRVQETQVEFSRFSLLGAHSPFDPLLTSSYSINSTTAAPVSTLQGTGGLNVNVESTTQFAQFNYSQTFESGTNLQVGMTSNNNFTNNSFYLLNPYITSALTFQFTQPLLRNGWLFPNRAPLIIARRNLEQSKASFAAEVSNNILQAANQYWAVVEAQGSLDVAKRSLDAAEQSYKRDKRALELGALPPLDIYRSESEVASRRVQVIQSEYALKQAEDTLRMTIGADQDPYYEALDLDLTETPEPAGELRTIDNATALQEALLKRPEFQVTSAALAIDDARIRLAHNHLMPELDLNAYYTSNGVGGTQFNAMGNKTTSSSIGQLMGFNYPTYQAQISLSLPIRNRSAQAELGNALVSRRSDLYNERQWREQVALDVRNAVHQLEESKLSIAAGKEAVDLAKKNTAAEQRKYELGQGTIFLVLEAQTELATAEQSLLQAEIGYQLAVAGLDHATGQLLEPYNVQIAELTR
ncbi:MAG TPA: TolC family protein [Verrucomicrobiae bacterium]|nr:TolC family protein [Verrucomicrobiae bacterium]